MAFETELDRQRTDGLRRGEAGDITAHRKTTFQPQTSGRHHSGSKKESKPKGHEAFLKALETSGASICVEFMESIPADPMLIVGVVKHSDSYTISLVDEEGETHVIFKHSIRKFICLTRKEEE